MMTIGLTVVAVNINVIENSITINPYIMKRVYFVPLIIVFFLIGCVQKTSQPDTENDIAAIHALYDKYLECINTENLDEFLTIWTDDAIRSEPEKPEIIGIEKLTPHFSYFHKNFDMTMDYASRIQVEVCGDQAYAMGVVTYSAAPLAGGLRWRLSHCAAARAIRSCPPSKIVTRAFPAVRRR